MIIRFLAEPFRQKLIIIRDGDNNPDTDNTLEEYPAPDRSSIAAFPGAYGAGRFTEAEQVERCMW